MTDNAKYINQINVIKEEINENDKDDTMEIVVEGIDDLDIDQDEDLDEDDVVLFIEYKYCTICHIEQPLRCKHCKTCDHCVATYDHHCPWIGNCVGERNRFRFFCFLFFQFIQLLIGLAICSQVLIWNFKDDDLLTESNQLIILFLFLITVGFTLFVAPLLIFQFVLILRNMTSWEFMSWMRITYLKVWPRKYGSPFS
jgi:palmitoyltransferase